MGVTERAVPVIDPVFLTIKVISVETQLWLISAGRVRGGGTLGAKEGAVEPTGMYSWRVPTPRTRAVSSQLSFSTNRHN